MISEYPEKNFKQRVVEGAPLMVGAFLLMAKWLTFLSLLQQYPALFLHAEKVAGMAILGAVIGTLGLIAERRVNEQTTGEPTKERMSISSTVLPAVAMGIFWPWGIADGSYKLAKSAATVVGRRLQGKGKS